MIFITRVKYRSYFNSGDEYAVATAKVYFGGHDADAPKGDRLAQYCGEELVRHGFVVNEEYVPGNRILSVAVLREE